MADISKITLPNGNTYNLKDALARQITASAIVLCGKTSTPLADDATTTPVIIPEATTIRGVDYPAGSSYTPVSGDAFFYNAKEFIFDGTRWHEFGDMTNLSASGSVTIKPKGDVSSTFSDGSVTASGSYTPSGDVTFTTGTQTASVATGEGDVTYTPAGEVSAAFSGTSFNSTGSYTPEGTVSAAFSGTSFDSTGSYTPEGTVSAAFSGNALTSTGNFKPTGTVSTPTITVKTAGTTDTIHNPTANTVLTALDAGTLPSCTHPVLSTTVQDENLTLSWTEGTWNAGALPSASTGASITTTDVTVKTSDAAYEASQPTFTGDDGSVSVSGTPTGSITGAAFTGTAKDVTVSGTATGNITGAAFTGTAKDVTVSGTATGSITGAKFTGTGVHLETASITVPTSASFTGTADTVDVTGTATGTVTSTFDGTSETYPVTVNINK